MSRQLKLLQFALTSLLRRPAKNLSILMVYALTVALLASVLFLTSALRREADQLLTGAPELVVQNVLAGRHELVSITDAAKIAEIPGVSGVEPRIWGYYYDALTEANYTLQGVGASAETLTLLRGRLPHRAGECAIGSGIATLRQASLGDDLVLIDQTNLGTSFEIVGIFSAEAELLTNDLVLFEAQDLRAFFALPAGKATDFAVTVPNAREVDTVARKIKALLPAARPISRSELIRTYDAVFSWRSGMLLSIFSLTLLAFCVFAWDKATGLSAEERREIGVLKALGWETADVLLLKFWEGLAVSLTAFLLGTILAFLHVFWFGAPLLNAVVRGWSTLFPRFAPIPYIDPAQLLTLAFLTVVPYLASTVVPCWKAAIADPDSVLRGE